MSDNAVTAGREAWTRLLDRERSTWQDWLAVGRALLIGRAACLQIAKTNKPVGTRYDRAIGAWLAESKLDGITNQERYRALLCLENLGTVEAWRADLNDAQRRQPNHPNAVWFAWRRSMKAREPKPAREPAKVQGSNQARADFEQAWQVFLANRTETDFQAWRDQRDWTARKYAMWKAGEKLPSQNRVR